MPGKYTEYYHSECKSYGSDGVCMGFILLKIEAHVTHNANDIQRESRARTEKQKAKAGAKRCCSLYDEQAAFSIYLI